LRKYSFVRVVMYVCIKESNDESFVIRSAQSAADVGVNFLEFFRAFDQVVHDVAQTVDSLVQL